jgi:cold shock CspA family protein
MRYRPFDRLSFSRTTGKALFMRITGTVKFFNASALERAGIRILNEGDKVTFTLEDDRRGRGKQAGQIEKA